MSLFGSLFAGVSGLTVQSDNIGVISDNVSNVNTIGFKYRSSAFETLVTNRSGGLGFNPGGALSNTLQASDVQGLLEATNSNTDLAISGAGLFVVNDLVNSSGNTLFTRAGDFQLDSQGNFVNSAGYFLQAWPLDRDGRLPGEPGNLNTIPNSSVDSLQTVNVEQTTGTVAATTSVEIGANLDAEQEVLQGSGETIIFATNVENQDIAANSIIIPTAGVQDQTDILTVDTGGITYNFEYGGIATSTFANIDFTGFGGINPAATSDNFFAAGVVTAANDEFFINTPTTGTVSFKYVDASPNPFQQEFNDVDSLVAAVNEVPGLYARTDTAGNFYIAPEDANEQLTFTSEGAINWVTGFGAGFGNTAAPSGVAPRFASLQDLANKVEAETGISAIVENPLSQARVTLVTDNPLEDITFSSTGPISGNAADALALEFGLDDDDNPGVLVFDQRYDPNDETKNMTTGAITPQFTITRTIFDSLGAPHNIIHAFVKTANNQWAIETYGADSGDVLGNLPGGSDQIFFGDIVFNGDGSLRSVSSNLTAPVDIVWSNGSLPSAVQFDFGTAGQPVGTVNATQIGLTDGISQFAADYNVGFYVQNGAEVGSLISVNIADDGTVFANFSNGESQALYRVPLADFAAPNNLEARSGNIWFATEAAGELNLRTAGTNGLGEVVAGTIENSNVELADQLTDLIIAQRSFQANTQLVSTSDELLEELIRI